VKKFSLVVALALTACGGADTSPQPSGSSSNSTSGWPAGTVTSSCKCYQSSLSPSLPDTTNNWNNNCASGQEGAYSCSASGCAAPHQEYSAVFGHNMWVWGEYRACL
jgi:hypothetical protein